MTKIKNDYKIEDIIALVNSYNKDNVDLINKCYLYANKILDKDKLQDAINVSYILTTVQADAETIAANILSYLLINNLEMTGRFIISNSDGKWVSPYIEFKPGESYDVYYGYADNYSNEQLAFEKFVDMDLTFYVFENNENNGWPHVKDYKVHID